MNDFLNPYIAGAPVVEPSMFFGRQDVFDWIEQNLSGRFVNHILVIHGQRRVGKTSVLKQIPNHLPVNFINIFFDLQGRTHTSLDRFQWWLAREICRSVNQHRGTSIIAPDHNLFAQDSEYLASTFLPEVLSKLDESILLMTFDEFDTLSEPEIQQTLTQPLIAYLRRLFDLPRLNFIFSIGSSGHKLENMQASYTEFFKTALYRKISFLKHEDCAHLITRPVQGMLSYEPKAVERIYAITSGHPYFTQLICHELFSLSQKTGRRMLTMEDVESVLEDVIERGTVNLKFVWDEATDLEKWVLSCLAHELQSLELDTRSLGIQKQLVCTDRQLNNALHEQHVRYSENDLNTALVHLREKDVLTQQNHFIVELLCIWLLKNRPLDRVRDELVQVNPIANRYNEIGDEFHSLGQKDKALGSFQQALVVDPLNLRARLSIAGLHLEERNYNEAVQEYEAALKIDDDDVVARSGVCAALMALGDSAIASGRLADAAVYFQRVLTANPDHPEAHLRSAVVYQRQAEEALSAGNAELALNQFLVALGHSPDDQQLSIRYAQVKEEHTKRLIAGLLQQFKEAQERQDWELAVDTIQRALQLEPNEPSLLKYLTVVKDAPRLAKITHLQAHAQEMERCENWELAVKDWETCLTLHPEDEGEVRSSLEHARQRQKLAADYNQAQAAIKERHYNQAISMLQGIISIDASYKDSAVLLVDCLKVHPKRELKLPATLKLQKIPVRILGWLALGLGLTGVVIGIATQWSKISPLLVGLMQPTAPIATQAPGPTAPATLTAGSPPATATAAGQASLSFLEERNKYAFRPADVQDNFSSASLQDYWNIDKGVQNATLHDGFLSLNNEYLIGDESLKCMNYILQVDIRFNGIKQNEIFVYGLRLTPMPGNLGTEYLLNIKPSTGEWVLKVITDPYGEYTVSQKGNLGKIMPVDWHELGVIVYNRSVHLFWDGEIFLTQDNVELFGTSNHFGLDASTAELANLDIDNWHFWNLGEPAYMRNDWVLSAPATLMEDNFTNDGGWQFSPQENAKYEEGMAGLATTGGETSLSRDDLSGTNIALEVSFIPREMPDSATLIWTLGMDGATSNHFAFEYCPENGIWSIIEGKDKNWDKLLTGITQPTPVDTLGTIMVVVDGTQVSAFYSGAFLNSINMGYASPGEENLLILRNNESSTARVNITSVHYWNLDMVEWTTDDWISARPETVLIDSFTGIEGLQFYPNDFETFVDGKAVLYTEGGDTLLTHEGLQGAKIAFEVTFNSINMPDSASVVWNLGKDSTTLDCMEFSYFPATGAWQINKVTKRRWELFAEGTAQPTPDQTEATIMVVLDEYKVRAFMDGTRIGSAAITFPVTGLRNEVGIRNRESIYSRIDILKIRFWNLDMEVVSGGNADEPGKLNYSLADVVKDVTSGRDPDFTDDFSSPTQ